MELSSEPYGRLITNIRLADSYLSTFDLLYANVFAVVFDPGR